MDYRTIIDILSRKTTVPGDGYSFEQIDEAIDTTISILKALPEWHYTDVEYPDDDCDGMYFICHVSISDAVEPQCILPLKYEVHCIGDIEVRRWMYEGREFSGVVRDWKPLSQVV